MCSNIKGKKLKASFTVEASVVMSACILLIAAVIMLAITLQGKYISLCSARLEDEINCIDVMNGRDADLEKDYERAPDILYKYRAAENILN